MKSILAMDRDELRKLGELCGALRGKLEFFLLQNYEREVRRLTKHSADGVQDEKTLINRAIERLFHDWHSADGSRPIEWFLRGGSPLGPEGWIPEPLTPEEAQIAPGWASSVLGVFRIKSLDDMIIETRNLVDDMDYILLMGKPEAGRTRSLGPGACLYGRLLPVGDAWTVSGNLMIFDRSKVDQAWEMAAQLAFSMPRLFYRNPDHLRLAQGSAMEQHRLFKVTVGTSWFVGTPAEAEELQRSLLEQVAGTERSKEAISAARRTADAFHLPAELQKATTVGLFSHPQLGTLFYGNAHVLVEMLDSPELAAKDPWRKALTRLLEGDANLCSVLSALGLAAPTRLSKTLQVYTGTPDFDWSRDSEALLRRVNPQYFENPPLPTALPLRGELAAAQLRKVNRAALPKQQPKQQPKQLPGQKPKTGSRSSNRQPAQPPSRKRK